MTVAMRHWYQPGYRGVESTIAGAEFRLNVIDLISTALIMLSLLATHSCNLHKVVAP